MYTLSFFTNFIASYNIIWKIDFRHEFSFFSGFPFSFFNDPFLLFILASIAASHKTATDSDLLNNITGVLKYAHDKIGTGNVER